MKEPNEFRVSTASRPRRAEATHVLVIVNPGSRGGRNALASTLAAPRDTGLQPEVAETAAPRHATMLVRDRVSASPARYAAVLSLGGDGTAMEVASALAELPNAPPLGIVAVGTANILARSLEIPGNPRPMQADGELLGLTPVDIRVEPNAVRVLVPQATPRRWLMPRLAATRGHTEQLESCTP